MGSMLAMITDGSTAFIAFTVMMILIFVALVADHRPRALSAQPSVRAASFAARTVRSTSSSVCAADRNHAS